MIESSRATRAPLKPVPEGWRRYAIIGSLAIAVLGALAALGAVRLMAYWLTLPR